MRAPLAPTLMMALTLALPAPLAAQIPQQPAAQPPAPISGFTHSFRSAFGVSYADTAAQPVQPGIGGIYTLGFQHRTDGGIGFDFRLQRRGSNFPMTDTPAHGESRN